MTYYAVDTVESGGIPRFEYRVEPEPGQITSDIITIEFKPEKHPLDEYSYSHPEFTLTQRVVLKEHYEALEMCKMQFSDEYDSSTLKYYRICAIEIVEPKSSSGRLTDDPYYLFGIRCETGTKEMMWFSSDELIASRELEAIAFELSEI
jgi:hypothetical protein